MSRPRPNALAFVAISGLVGFASGEVRAQLPVTLDYSVPSECPGIGDFKATVSERLGEDVFTESAPNRVLVRVTSRAGTFDGHMEWRDVEGNWAGERTFPSRSNDCADLVRAMAFTLALQLQFSAAAIAPPGTGDSAAHPQSTTEPAPPASVPPSREPPRPEPPTLTPGAVHPPATRSRYPIVAVGAGAFIGFGMSSAAVPFVRAFGRAAWPLWSLSIAAEGSVGATIRRADGAGVSHQQLLAAVAGCREFQGWSACVVAKGGQIRVSGKDVDVPASDTAPVIQTGLRADARQRILPHTFVSVHAEALVLPIRWAVTLDQTAVFTSPRFAETIGFDVGFSFE